MGDPRPPLRFLVVEDEALLAMDIGLMIEDAGHVAVAEAASLREVQTFGPGIAPHVAFVDVQLAEGSSGLDVCAHIRQHWNDVIIVFVTANPKKLPADFAGGDGVVSKPFSRSGMMSVIRYLAEGVCAPPPGLPVPPDLTAAPTLAASWKSGAPLLQSRAAP